MITVAAVGDVHMDQEMRGRYRPRLGGLAGDADVLLLAGDLTKHGTVEEAQVVADEFRDLPVPVVAVLGNHDYHSDAHEEIAALLRAVGITVVEGEGTVVVCPGGRLGVAGVKGFALGFPGQCASEFGEPEMKCFARSSREAAERLGAALASLDADTVVALTHYAPVRDTLAGEPVEIFPFLGSYLLAEAIDAAGAALAVHGHAHRGTEVGMTAGGVPVRNVALPVLGRPYGVYRLDERTTQPTR